jgi:glyoxylase-like metal-dependent hydrolase (beta-lactamase superfamily II)
MTTEALPAVARSFPRHGPLIEVSHDIACVQTMIANVIFVGDPHRGSWVLVDAGMPFCAGKIRRAADQRFGPNARPRAIVLTHGHFDHVGSLRALIDAWDVPVYAHRLEMPYLSGRAKYPPPDPTVGGGLFARVSPTFPRGPFDFGDRLEPLPYSGDVPHMPGWRWVATPGHSPGHVSLFRDADRALIAGDAFVTTKQESFLAVMSQAPEMHGPPMYWTQDWESARESVVALAALEPEVAVTGHGLPLRGEALRASLHDLARNFDQVARPRDGRYVREPAIADESGTYFLPPPVPDPVSKVALGVAVAAVGALALGAFARRDRR